MKMVVVMIALLIGLTACHAGIAIGDNGQQPTYAGTDAWGSALAQASIGTVGGE
jgi:hypothetical protein